MRIFSGLLFLVIAHLVAAEPVTLTLSVKQQKIDVPFWASKKIGSGGMVIVVGDNEGQLFLQQFSSQMTTFGWSVILLKSVKDLPWLEQLPEALSALRQKNNKRIVVMHYGDQLKELLDYFNKPQSKQADALVLLSSYDLPEEKKEDSKTTTQTEQKNSKTIKLRFSVLDIAGQFDYPSVLEQYAKRASVFAPDSYQQLLVPGADHDYAYQQAILASYINGKMSHLTVRQLSRPPIPLK